jgi:putative ABC transport system substrate-binding protein
MARIAIRAVLAVVLVLLLSPLAASAQQAGKVYRIGFLGNSGSTPLGARFVEAFRLGLRERGWIEGQNLVIEYRWAEGNPDRLPALAADLVRLKVDLIVAASSTFVQPAKEATSTIPIVFPIHADPVGTGHVASLAHPGGNITGLATLQTDLGPKGLELLNAAVPGAKRVAVLWNPSTPSHAPGLKAVENAGRTLGLQLQPLGVRSAGEIESAFAAMERERAAALLVLTSPLSGSEGRRLADLALSHRLPTMFERRENVESGGLMSYGTDFPDMFRRSAAYVDKILKGAKPADLPVEQASKFELVINLKTAKALGLTIPPSLLGRADEVIR